MKKIVTICLSMALALLLLAGCGNSQSQTPATTEPAVTGPASALEILETVWGQYAEEEKFSIIGGNMEANIMGQPGNYDLAYAENMTYNLLVPADQIENISEAASMIHMMNANTFTCGAFQLKEGVSAADFASAMEAAVQGNMWMCGFPERLIITGIGDSFVVVAFGVGDVMTPYAEHLAAAYPGASTLCDEPIA